MFLVFARIGSWASYEHVEDKWVPEIVHHCPAVPFLIVGVGSHDDDELLEKSRRSGLPSKREDYTRKGHDLAKQLGAVKYVECDIFTQRHLKEVFDEVSYDKTGFFPLFYLQQALTPVFANAFPTFLGHYSGPGTPMVQETQATVLEAGFFERAEGNQGG